MRHRHPIAALLLVFGSSFALAQVAPQYQKEAMAAYREKQFAKCAAMFVDAVRTQPSQALTPPIGAARCYAGAGDTARTRRYLRLALDRGYRNCKLLQDEAVFKELRESKGWVESQERCRANEERFYTSLNAELFVAFLSDQSDRMADDLDVSRVLERDAQRRRLVSIAIGRNTVRTAEDYYHAAVIMQHGESVEDIALARRLVQRSTELDPTNGSALWLFAATTDRLLHMSGKPQIYGTQLKQTGGLWTRDPYDPNAVSDAERARWRVPSLAEQRQELEELNQKQ